MLRNAPDKKKRRKQKQMRNEGLHRRKENNTPEGAGDDPKRESDNEDPLRLALQGERRERREKDALRRRHSGRREDGDTISYQQTIRRERGKREERDADSIRG